MSETEIFKAVISHNIGERTFWEYLADQVFNPKYNLFFFKKEKREYIVYKINRVLFNVIVKLLYPEIFAQDIELLEQKFNIKFKEKNFVEIISYKNER